MSTNEFSLIISRPVREVFDYMDDVNREREWQPNIRSAKAEPEGPTQVGTKKTYVSDFMGREVKNTYVTKVFDRNKRVVYETTPKSSVDARASLQFEETENGTKVSMKVEAEPRGLLSLIPRGVLESFSQNELEKTLQRLKKRLEAKN